MKLYLVIERNAQEDMDDWVFGVFSTKKKATEIKETLMKNFVEHNERHTVDIIELECDKPTEDYEWFMCN